LFLSYGELIKAWFSGEAVENSDFKQGEWDLWVEEVHIELREQTQTPEVLEAPH